MNCWPSEADAAAVAGFDRWRAGLSLRYARRGDASVPVLRRHHGPLRVQKHFHPEGPAVCHHILVHPPGGIAGGDGLCIDVALETGAHALITSPGAAKWYRGTQEATLDLRLSLEGDAVLEWLPLETILFAGARAAIDYRVELGAAARLLFADVLCLGRPGSGEAFSAGHWRQAGEIRRDGRLLWCEQAHVRGDDPLLAHAAGLGGATVLGTLLWAGGPLPEALHEACRAVPVTGGRASATQLPGLWSARCLCTSAEDAHRWLRAVWTLLRPSLLARAAVPPRIWAT